MPDRGFVTGALVGAIARPFKSFTDTRTGEVKPAGIARRLWVAGLLEEGPVQVRVPDGLSGDFSKLVEAGFGAEVELIVDLRAVREGEFGTRIDRTLEEVRSVKPAA